MEATVLVGRDCRVIYQNSRSRKLIGYPYGTPIIWEAPVIPIEQIRDAIFADKPFSYVDLPTDPEIVKKDRLVTRDFRPLRDDAGVIIGIISLGYSRERSGPSELDKLREIIEALEVPGSPIGESGAEPLPGSFLGASAGSLALARRLRQHLPPIGH